MASNYTENFGLCQWEATDQVLREEFNQNNTRVDEALKSASELAQAAQALADSAYGPDNTPFAVGSYTGDGTDKRKIDLGFTPKAVFLSASSSIFYQRYNTYNAVSAAFAISGKNAAQNSTGIESWVSGITLLSITDGGFYVTYFRDTTFHGDLNTKDKVYYYIAMK